MKKVFFIILCSLVAIHSHAAYWIQYNTESKKAKYHYDMDSLVSKKFTNGSRYLQVWEKSVYNEEQTISERNYSCISYSIYCSEYTFKKYSEEKTVNYYDCKNKKLAVGRVLKYNSDGEVVDSSPDYVATSSSASWNETIPDTIGEGKLNEICKQEYLATKS